MKRFLITLIALALVVPTAWAGGLAGVKMDDGDVVEMTLVPGKGTTVVVNGATKGTIEGDDFAEALVNVWVGASPPTDEFKKGVLGG